MTPRSFLLSPELHAYVVAHSSPPDPIEAGLIAETATLGGPAGMQIGPDQAAFLTLLTRLLDARTVIEVGTFTGYSALAIARGLPSDGRLLCLDVSPEWTSIAQRHWRSAGVAERIELRLGPALDTLRSLPSEPVYDLAFVDADKKEYPDYFAELLPRLRAGGLMVVDNVLWSGRVLDAADDDPDLVAIRRFNDLAAADQRVDAVLLPVADGLSLLRKR